MVAKSAAPSLVPAMPVKPKEHEDGIYFGLNEAEYHDDPALGSTDVRNLLIHPSEYWWQSWMNPQHEPWQTKFTEWGNAFHALICEGLEQFEQRYFRGPSKADYEGLMVTMDDMKRWLQLHGYAQTGNKATLTERVLNADPAAPVWDEIVRKQEVLAEGRIVLDPKEYDLVKLSSNMIIKNPTCAKAFTNGYPEVSIFYTDRHGVRQKGRIDYMRFHANVDLKSFRNWRDKPIGKAIKDTIRWSWYDIQAAHYLRLREQVPAFVKAGKVFGEVSSSWIERLAATKDFRHVWIFYQADGAPIARRYEYLRDDPDYEACCREITIALDRYRQHMDVFGTEMWVDVSDPEIITGDDLPVRMGV